MSLSLNWQKGINMHDPLEWLLDSLPPEQREEAKRLYIAADAAGWRSIGLWTYDEPDDITDLFGVEPRTGWGSFINDKSIAESLIPLAPEVKAENDRMWADFKASLKKRLEAEHEDQAAEAGE
jgi:hypothetical protein